MNCCGQIVHRSVQYQYIPLFVLPLVIKPYDEDQPVVKYSCVNGLGFYSRLQQTCQERNTGMTF